MLSGLALLSVLEMLHYDLPPGVGPPAGRHTTQVYSQSLELYDYGVGGSSRAFHLIGMI
jgi:hypothetical protein